MPEKNQPKGYYDSAAEDYYKIYQPEKLLYRDGAGDYFRLQMILRLISEFEAKAVFEVGVDYKVNWAYRGAGLAVDEGLFGTFRDPFDDEDGTYCDHVVNTVSIRADGSIVPCCYGLCQSKSA